MAIDYISISAETSFFFVFFFKYMENHVNKQKIIVFGKDGKPFCLRWSDTLANVEPHVQQQNY